MSEGAGDDEHQVLVKTCRSGIEAEPEEAWMRYVLVLRCDAVHTLLKGNMQPRYVRPKRPLRDYKPLSLRSRCRLVNTFLSAPKDAVADFIKVESTWPYASVFF